MGTCLSKKKGSSSSTTPSSHVPEAKSVSTLKDDSEDAIAVSKPKVETESEVNNAVKQEANQGDEGGQLKKEIFIIKHRKSHDDRERNSKCPPPVRQNAAAPLEPVLDGVASSEGRRRTPSRERDQQHQHQRSSSRERRVSRSPGRRSSETSNPTSTNPASAIASNNNNNSNSTARPGKMVSVPPTVSSLAMDKSNNGGGGAESAATTGMKKISVKRNIGDNGMVGSRSAASPRSQSPARANGNGNSANCKALGDNQQQQQPSLSRSSSRKADQSPYRRNPLSDIDPNSLAYPQSASNKKQNIDVNDNTKNRTRGVSVNCKPKEQQQEEEVKGHSSMIEHVVVKTVVPSGVVVDNLKPSQTLTRSRSSRRSRDLDHLNPEALLLNPEQSYTSLLLEDIHNFHQKTTTSSTPSVPLPACVTKACSILEAVADLNSTTSSNLSGPFTYESTMNLKRVTDTKDPFVESEVAVHDDVMEPSFHKYVTVKRGGSVVGAGGVDMEDQESSGSNSFTVSGQQNWGLSSSSWEPNSADSTDCWTSRLNTREEVLEKSPLGLEMDEARKKSNGKRRECDHQHSNGIGRGRIGANKGLHTIAVTAAAAST
ncbi:uncharacterized protein G2W53_013532 [Senna tora]|uniref:Uncharacterized protein n=1 Tax=Senna tora TaxID=362788 RepID=A0A834WSS5_9FABA|nr:uncharacterized protein G2W53_013532 [Senna tora]